MKKVVQPRDAGTAGSRDGPAGPAMHSKDPWGRNIKCGLHPSQHPCLTCRRCAVIRSVWISACLIDSCFALLALLDPSPAPKAQANNANARAHPVRVIPHFIFLALPTSDAFLPEPPGLSLPSLSFWGSEEGGDGVRAGMFRATV